MDRDTDIVEMYDPDEDRWERRADMPAPRHGHSAVVVNGKILVIGGYRFSGRLTPLSTVEEYDPATDRWTTKADMPTPRGFLGVAVAKGYVYAFAGRLPRSAPPVERYDPEANTWEPLGTMPEGFRNRFGIATVNDMIYVLGGEFQGDAQTPVSVLRYEPEDGR